MEFFLRVNGLYVVTLAIVLSNLLYIYIFKEDYLYEKNFTVKSASVTIYKH